MSEKTYCGGKVRYKTSGHAYKTMKQRQRDQKSPEGLQIYICATCLGWHFGTYEEKKIEKKALRKAMRKGLVLPLSV